MSSMMGMARQVGGGHYKSMGCQPLEVTYLNFGYAGLQAAVYCKVNKYLARDKDHELHAQDLKKAMHCIEIQLEYLERARSE